MAKNLVSCPRIHQAGCKTQDGFHRDRFLFDWTKVLVKNTEERAPGTLWLLMLVPAITHHPPHLSGLLSLISSVAKSRPCNPFNWVIYRATPMYQMWVWLEANEIYVEGPDELSIGNYTKTPMERLPLPGLDVGWALGRGKI